MSIFGKIKDAIFGKKSAPAPAPSPTSGGTLQPPPSSGAATTSPTSQTSQPQPQSQVDVEQVLTGIASSKGNPDLNWRTSIVDLMKLLDMDSSLANRKELATELGYTGEKDGSAEMNLWLHKEVMRQLAAHGGKVPANLTD
ncbi:hypothetical protein GGQ97_000389 [Sphingomonas kaistensis]|uniref:DUF3597 domain-containing protein n=1 Tax=Sphingomonas kaistensis TaxID=298708 RepID=A0A7X6BG19_9SPHN|nr:DUF3597 domain-containing protein [Sphingomonas kaistensis]NJC04596.1 hypothetical protein [Sphingomonas kaistensis]